MIAWRFLGDTAICLDVGGDAPLEANAIVHELGRRLRDARVPGVRDVVPAMTTLTLHVDPLRTDLGTIESLVADTPDEIRVACATGQEHEVPVRYGADAGPDLETVARATGLTAADVVRRHLASTYQVCFLGFMPGFAYLGLVPETLRVPRRETPRTLVPAGSVAIADVFTAVYPSDSPGGWHVIGRTDRPLFDLSRRQPSLFAPGDHVRFVEA